MRRCQCLGPFAALLLSEPGQVQRRDGKKPVIVSNRDGFIGELKATVKVWKKPSNLLYAIAFFVRLPSAGPESSRAPDELTLPLSLSLSRPRTDDAVGPWKHELVPHDVCVSPATPETGDGSS